MTLRISAISYTKGRTPTHIAMHGHPHDTQISTDTHKKHFAPAFPILHALKRRTNEVAVEDSHLDRRHTCHPPLCSGDAIIRGNEKTRGAAGSCFLNSLPQRHGNVSHRCQPPPPPPTHFCDLERICDDDRDGCLRDCCV